MKDIIYFIIFLLIAALIGYGLDTIFSSLLASKATFFVQQHSIGIRPISISISVCGIVGIVCSYLIMKFLRRL